MFSVSYYNLQETASQTVLRLPDLVRAAGGDNPPAFGTTARPHVNDIVGVSDDIRVMLLQKRLDIGRMKADRRLVEDEYGVTLSPARLAGKIQALGLTAG